MSHWYSKELGDGVSAFLPSQQIHEAFDPFVAASGCSIEMAVFSHYDNENNVVTAYFSPNASVLAKLFDAVPCDKPKKVESFGLLAGDARCLKLFYPSSQ